MVKLIIEVTIERFWRQNFLQSNICISNYIRLLDKEIKLFLKMFSNIISLYIFVDNVILILASYPGSQE